MQHDIDLRITRASYVYIDFDYDKRILKYVKENIPGRKYVKRSKEWKFKLDKHSIRAFFDFLREFDISNPPDEIQDRMKEIIQDVKQREKQKKRNLELVEKDDLPDFQVKGTRRGMELYPFQKVGVKYAVENKNVIIGDQPGLGKTASAINAIHHQDAYPCLVVCPATLKDHWKREWNQWLPRKTCKVQSSKNLDFNCRVSVINYSILWKYRKEIKDWGFNSLILDESHYVKNKDSQRSKAARQIAKSINGPKILLSGTAVVNRPKELINQLKIIDRFKQEFGGFWQFTKRFCNGHDSRYGYYDYDGASNLEELHQRLTSCCYIRRNKRDVLDDLPDKQFSHVVFELDNRKKYRLAENDIAAYMQTFEDCTSEGYANKLAKLAKLRKLSGVGKVKQAKSWISNFLESGEKLVLFAHHKDVISEIMEQFPDALCITGDTPNGDRQNIVDQFQEDPDEKLIVLNMQAGGTGLTLTASSTVAFLELPWTPGEIEQCSDRVHRISQKDAVNIYFLVAENTIDTDMLELLEQKRVVTEAVNAGNRISDDSGNIVDRLIKNIKRKHE